MGHNIGYHGWKAARNEEVHGTLPIFQVSRPSSSNSPPGDGSNADLLKSARITLAPK